MEDFNSISYRKGLLPDLPLIYEMEKKCFNKYDCLNPEQIKWYLKNPCSSVLVDIIEVNNMAAGWASYFTRKNSKTIRLYSLCIIPEYSGRGFAQKYLIQRMKTLGDYMKIVLEVRVSNDKAAGLYKKLGFITKKRMPGYYPDGEDGFKMIKNIKSE